MKKALMRSLSLLLAITIIFSSAYVGLSEVDFGSLFAVRAEAATGGKCGYNVTWVLNNGTLTISGTGNMFDYSASYGTGPEASSAPWYNSRQSIKSIVVDDMVTSIGWYAFDGCTSLTTIILGSKITSIGWYAFDGCTSLTEISIPDSVTSIGGGAFSGCTSLSFITIPDSVTNIGSYVFMDCTNLTSITIPDSITNIGEYAFCGCTGLVSIAISHSVTVIEKFSFYGCTNLTSITIPDSVTSISGYAFWECTNLISITIPDSVTNIGYSAFEDCQSLTSITIPYSVISIGDYAFRGCKSLTSIKVDENNPNYCSNDGILFNKDKTVLIKYPSTKTNTLYDIPDGVTDITGYAFQYCTSLESITIPNSVTSMGMGTFAGCINLSSIIILDGITNISDFTFSGCTSLTSVTIPSSVTYIGYMAFYECTSLIDVCYCGNAEQWNEIIIDSENGCLLSANIIFNVSSEYVPTVVNNGTFTCIDFTYSGENGFDYDDAYFDKPATEYNHELATMSLCLALSTFRDKEDSENSGDNVVSVLKQCGFKNEVYDTLETEPGTDSIGYAIAKKQVGDTTLIVCAVRSGGYDDEWASNVTLGDINDHKGFDFAATQIVDALNDYIGVNQEGNIKFWLVGYSRGAATATQAAAKLIKDSVAEKDDVYAYGFATPAGAISDSNPQSDNYANIHNILHFHDLVPRVAPKDWNFGRYGNVYYLPFKENGTLALERTREMRGILEKYNIPFLSNVMDIIIYDKDGNFRGSPGVVSDDLVKNLARKIETRENYVDDYQYLLRAVLGEGITEKALVQVSKILIGIITGVTKTIIGNNQNDVEKQIEEIEKADKLDKNLLKVVGEIISATASTHGTNGAYYLSWMQAMPDGSWLNDGKYRQVNVNCPVDIYVYDSNGNLVASIIDEKALNIENSGIVYGIDENGQKVFYLPVDSEYDMKIEAREDCETTYTVNEYSAGSGVPTRIVTYTEIPMETGDIIESSASEMVENPNDGGTIETTAEYEVEQNNQVVEPTVDVDDKEVENYTYTVTATCDETKGVVYGGGVFTIGEFCQVEATNKPGYKFSKWTVNGETVSTETTYRFAVTEDVTLVAEYVPCEHLKYKAEVVAPTCTVDGYTKHTCEVCSHSYNDNIVKSNGHSSSNWIIDEDKHTMHTECTICKEVIETKNITVSATKLTSCYNEVKGVQLKWNAVSGAKSYKVYRKLPSQTEWVEIKSTTALEYQDTNVTGNTVYQYSVKAVDQYGNESDYSPQRECRFIETPTLLSRTNAVGGVTIKWKKVAGATSYRIYRRGAGVNYWYYLGDFPATLDTFTDLETANYFPNDAQKNALAKPKSGNYYRYTVRASYDGEDSTGKDYLIYSGFDTNGLYLKYVATPKLTSISNATNGLQIKWNAVAGGGPVEYRVYRRGAGSTYWYYLGTTTNTTWTDSGVKVANGGYYRYTVRAVAGTNGKGWYSAFDTTGLYLMRLANPTLNSATSSSAGITVKWSAIKGTTGYYVYRKTANSGWTRIAAVGGTNNTTFLDKTAKKGTTYTYTVKAVYGATTSAYNTGISCKDKY